MDIDEESIKIDIEQQKRENLNQEVDKVFYETIYLLKNIGSHEKNKISLTEIHLTKLCFNMYFIKWIICIY